MSRLRLQLSLLVLLMGIMACSNSEMAVASQETPKIEYTLDTLSGMFLVKANGAGTVLGTNATEARSNEHPAMSVEFDYDFSMGRHEVTCGEFNKLMNAATGLSLDCANDSLPATNLTYYDAILFANERSKLEGLDTAYTYTSIVFDSEKHCNALEGFAYRPQIKAYRLPTEAEWSLVASQNWNLEKAWIAENSEYKKHLVCKKADDDEFCDLIGNVMEWVNDWLGNFSDTIVSNYVGAPDGGALGQRVVKGASYRNSVESIHLYSRGDVYTVTSSTRADYVGFRLAFGAIPDAVWIGNNGKVALNRIVPLVSLTTLRSLTGAYRAKLAFRNDNTGNLSFVDYSSGILSVVEIADTIDVYHPEISPDGKYVAFCSGLEGVSGKSSLYVRDLNVEGSNLVKLNVESAAIPRWRVLPDGDTVIVYVTDAGNNKSELDFKSASTWQVTFANGKFGIPQKLFDGAYHGGISEDNTLAVTGARLLRARIAKTNSTVQQNALDTVWYKNDNKGEQACNVSLARDSSKRTLFLDFGGKTGREFVGKNYGTHERLLVADASGKLKQSVASPLGWTFDHSEWTLGGENLAVATLVNANGAHTKIVLVNLTDDSLVELVEGDELWHPNLWIAQNSSMGENGLVDLDSAGRYFINQPENFLMSSSVELSIKLKMFWEKYRDLECIALGSSMILDAVIDDSVKTCKMLNMGVTLADMHLMKYVLLNYVFKYAPRVKAVVVELSPGLLYRAQSNYLDVLRQYSPGLIYDENHLNRQNVDLIATLSQEYSYPRNLFTQNYMDDSFLLESVSWGDTYVSVDVSQMPFESVDLQSSIQMLKMLKKESENRGVKFILAITPRNPDYAATNSFGLFGPSRDVAHQIIDELRKLGFEIFDENKDGNHDYTAEMAYNNSHLSYIGARQFTARLDSLLKTLR